MKTLKISLILVLFLLGCFNLKSQETNLYPMTEFTVLWEANPPQDMVQDYRVYLGLGSEATNLVYNLSSGGRTGLVVRSAVSTNTIDDFYATNFNIITLDSNTVTIAGKEKWPLFPKLIYVTATASNFWGESVYADGITLTNSLSPVKGMRVINMSKPNEPILGMGAPLPKDFEIVDSPEPDGPWRTVAKVTDLLAEYRNSYMGWWIKDMPYDKRFFNMVEVVPVE